MKVHKYVLGIMIMSAVTGFAQNKSESGKNEFRKLTPVKGGKERVSGPKFTSSSFEKKTKQNTPENLVFQLSRLEDKRIKLDKDETISAADKQVRLTKINQLFFQKKAEFIAYAENKGITNLTRKEQSYFLSLLKQDGKIEEYRKNIELIKNSQQ